MQDIRIKGFLENSIIDWDGRISAVVFIAGCSFSCPFCHNAGLVKNDAALPDIPPENILNFLKSKRGWIDGVVITGGEPCLNPGLPAFIRGIKGLGYPVKLDTNGYHPGVLKTLLKNRTLDYVAMDVKAPIGEKYRKMSSGKIDIENIRESIRILRDSKTEHEFRTTFVPGLLDKNDLAAIAENLKGAGKFYIQQFNPEKTLDPALGSVEPYGEDYLGQTLEECRKFIPNSGLRQ